MNGWRARRWTELMAVRTEHPIFLKCFLCYSQYRDTFRHTSFVILNIAKLSWKTSLVISKYDTFLKDFLAYFQMWNFLERLPLLFSIMRNFLTRLPLLFFLKWPSLAPALFSLSLLLATVSCNSHQVPMWVIGLADPTWPMRDSGSGWKAKNRLISPTGSRGIPPTLPTTRTALTYGKPGSVWFYRLVHKKTPPSLSNTRTVITYSKFRNSSSVVYPRNPSDSSNNEDCAHLW